MNVKNIVITGATGGIGQTLCRALAQQGMGIAACGTHEQTLALLRKELSTKGCNAFVSATDVTQDDQVQLFLKDAAAQFGPLDALVNLAGLSVPGKIWETEEAVYDKLMDVNVKGTYLMCRHFIPLAAENARIINLGSMAGRRTNGNAPLYCVAKSALNTLSQGLALQSSAQGIHVTTLNPGGADTPFWGDRPVQRDKLLKPQDVVDVILFVLQCDSRMVK